MLKLSFEDGFVDSPSPSLCGLPGWKAGMIGQWAVHNDEVVIGLSDGSCPFGILDDGPSVGVRVHFARRIYITDVYEEDRIYPVNANLYVSKNGKLTTRQEAPENPSVGFVIGPPSSTNLNLKFFWI